jgi:predicted metal-dependent hydrolase
MGLFSGRRRREPLPDYVVVVSPRARRARLTLTAGEPVRVTLPRGVPVGRAADVVADALPWIERTRLRLEAQAQTARDRAAEPLPDVVELPAVAQTWEVVYRRTEASGVRAVVRSPLAVTIEGRVSDEEACREALRRWLLATARRELPRLAWAVAGELGCAPRSVSVTWPRRRWGSCSSAGDIRLSAELLFLPAADVRAIIVHEFAHLAVLDHSARFYTEVRRLDPGAAPGRRRVPRHEMHTPGWAMRPVRG